MREELNKRMDKQDEKFEKLHNEMKHDIRVEWKKLRDQIQEETERME
jgi:hypothetical protein